MRACCLPLLQGRHAGGTNWHQHDTRSAVRDSGGLAEGVHSVRGGAILLSSSSSRCRQVQLSRIFRALILASGVALLLANTTFAQVSAPNNALQSTSWRWMYSVTDDDASVSPIDRDRYTIAFGADGTLTVRADCNQVSGTYRQVGRRLSLQLGPSTQAACPPGSRADVFLQQLGAVVSQVSTESVLVLDLQQDSGNMLFEPQPTRVLDRHELAGTGV